ncbi:hypothetical protein LINGRAHAP2_LOCUS28910 [Linum grandiflorum]
MEDGKVLCYIIVKDLLGTMNKHFKSQGTKQ